MSAGCRMCFLLIFLLPLFSFNRRKERQYTIHGYAQGTDYSVKYFAPDSLVSRHSVDSILMVIDSSMSLYKPYSLISKFNASATGLRIDGHFARVMKKSFEVYKNTAGRFDITVKPLVQAWGFGVRPVAGFPDSVAIKDLLKCVGMNGLSLQKDVLRKKRSCLQIDLNGIAQGYSVDVVADFLEHRGISAYVVEIGGELRMKGPKPDGTSFRIGIEGPSDDEHGEPGLRHTIAINKGAVTTSGNYRKFLEKGGQRVSHLIDPKTGYPLHNSMISVTLCATDAVTADGYDNALMAMELQEALAFVNEKKGMEAYIIYHDGEGKVRDTLTSGFKKMVVN